MNNITMTRRKTGSFLTHTISLVLDNWWRIFAVRSLDVMLVRLNLL